MAALDVPKTLCFAFAVAAQYVFCSVVLAPYVEFPTQTLVLAVVCVGLAAAYLFAEEMGRWVENVIASVRERPALLLTPLRAGIAIAVVAAGLYGLWRFLSSLDVAFFARHQWLFLGLYAIDALILFVAAAGEPGVKAMLRGKVGEAFAWTTALIRTVPIELWVFSTFFSFALKVVLVAALVVGVTGAVQILLFVFLPWLLVALAITALWQGSFGASARYLSWVLTAPPKAVVRNLLDLHTDALTCRNCEHTIPLVGVYRCTCRFQFKGHYFSWCPWCFRRFGFIDCPNEQCGMSRKRPFVY